MSRMEAALSAMFSGGGIIASGAGIDVSSLSAGQWVIAAALALVLVIVHLIAPWVARLPGSTQDRLASIGGGVAVAYVFVQLLPELAEGGRSLTDLPISDYAPTPVIESGLFLVALIGMIAIYSLDVLADNGRGSTRWLYGVHMAVFALINAIYAYTMPSLLTTGIDYAVLFTLAIGAHVLLVDRTLARAHPDLFRHEDRWIGIAGVVIGFGLAAVFPPVNELTLATTTALLGGGLLMTTFREELPVASKARLLWLLAGVIGMSALLLGAVTISSTG
jgi:hypothetical protein